jgi:hypothetical protein
MPRIVMYERVVMVNIFPTVRACCNGKYFPLCDFLAATKKKSASHIWWAVLAGRETLNLELIKRIGDGSSTRMWDDR